MNHVVLSSSANPYPALDVPITEIAFWNMKEGVDKCAFEDLLDEFARKVLNCGLISGG